LNRIILSIKLLLTCIQYYMPLNFFDCVVECANYIQTVENDDSIHKKDVLDGMRERISIMISKILTNNHYTSASFIGWQLETTV
jgi:hypothetical protein